MKKIKVMVVVGTRPEIIRLSRVIEKINENCELILVHTGQNYDYELSDIFFSEMRIPLPKIRLNIAGSSSSESIGNVIIQMDNVLRQECPDVMLVLGDTNSCLSVIPAKKLKVPTIHLEAGNRCFDMRVPEEVNRRIVDHTSDLNLTYSDIAREYLLREGLSPNFVIKVGSPMKEVLNYYKHDIDTSIILSKLQVCENNFFLVSAHREENIECDKNFSKLINILDVLADRYQLPILFSTHPRTRKKLIQRDIKAHKLVCFMKPLGFFDYVHLQTKAKAVISDSGTVTEEASILNIPSLNIRETHERPEGMELGAALMVGLNIDRIIQALDFLGKGSWGENRSDPIVSDYDISTVSDRVIKIIYSYIDYINLNIWKKE